MAALDEPGSQLALAVGSSQFRNAGGIVRKQGGLLIITLLALQAYINFKAAKANCNGCLLAAHRM